MHEQHCIFHFVDQMCMCKSSEARGGGRVMPWSKAEVCQHLSFVLTNSRLGLIFHLHYPKIVPLDTIYHCLGKQGR